MLLFDLLGLPVSTLNILIGAAIAFVPQAVNLWHDSRQRRVERETAIRREAFFMAAEGAGKTLSFLAAMTAWASGDDTVELEEPPGWMEKVYLVGKPRTVVA